jgi:hypothetical protein
MGKGDIFITPLNGEYGAMMINIAAETAIAQTISVVNTVWLCGAKRPKLMKMAVSHVTTTISKGNDRELSSDPRNISQ